MRKFFALICVAVAISFAAGCGKTEPAPSSTPPATETPTDGTTTPAGEQPAEGTNP